MSEPLQPIEESSIEPTDADSSTAEAAVDKGGNRPFEPTKEQRRNVLEMVGLGITQEGICRLIINPRTKLPIGDRTLRTYFRHELDTGMAYVSTQVGQSLLKKARGNRAGSVTAAIWLSKVLLGWKERVSVEVETKSGVLITPTGMTPQEWVKKMTEQNELAKEPGADAADTDTALAGADTDTTTPTED